MHTRQAESPSDLHQQQASPVKKIVTPTNRQLQVPKATNNISNSSFTHTSDSISSTIHLHEATQHSTKLTGHNYSSASNTPLSLNSIPSQQGNEIRKKHPFSPPLSSLLQYTHLDADIYITALVAQALDAICFAVVMQGLQEKSMWMDAEHSRLHKCGYINAFRKLPVNTTRFARWRTTPFCLRVCVSHSFSLVDLRRWIHPNHQACGLTSELLCISGFKACCLTYLTRMLRVSVDLEETSLFRQQIWSNA